MKKIALLLFLLFGLVQAGPAVYNLLSASPVVFLVDEEKTGDKAETEKNETKKVFTEYQLHAERVSARAAITFDHAERIHPSPCIEKVSPPPNFC